MNKRLVALVLSIVMITGLMTGCSSKGEKDPLLDNSKEDLVMYIRNLEKISEEDSARIEELETMLKGVQGETVETSAIKEFSDGTGRETLTSIDSMVTLPVPFEYPNASQSYNTSAVSISDNITVKPSPNWTVKLSGTQVDFQHTGSNISGIIKVGKIDSTAEKVQVSSLTDHINEFFSNMPPANITYKRLYVNQNWMGMDASAHTFIDEEDAQLRCGMIGFSDVCITYMFAYKGEADSSKDELILTLLQTMQIYSNELRIE